MSSMVLAVAPPTSYVGNCASYRPIKPRSHPAIRRTLSHWAATLSQQEQPAIRLAMAIPSLSMLRSSVLSGIAMRIGRGPEFAWSCRSSRRKHSHPVREDLVLDFVEYLKNHHDSGASQVVRDRMRMEEEWGMSIAIIARSAPPFLFTDIVLPRPICVILGLFVDPRLLKISAENSRPLLPLARSRMALTWLSFAAVRDNVSSAVCCVNASPRPGSVRLVQKDAIFGG